MIPRLAILLLALTAIACSKRSDDSAIVVSVIGPSPAIVDPSRKPLGPSAAVLLGATAQGLVRFDGAGQIEPGLAIRWGVSDDGLYYTFRLADDAGIDAETIARRLRAMIAPGSANPLRPVLGAIREVVAVTPQVVELRLIAPRPNLLDLLAQAEMAILNGKSAGGGPLRIAGDPGRFIRLAHPVDPALADEEEAPRQPDVLLRGERAAAAVARFADGASALVLGGRFTDIAIARAAQLRPRDLQVDPAVGQLGFVVAQPGAFLNAGENRRALSMAIDRARIMAAFNVQGWQPATTILPGGLIDLTVPVQPAWYGRPIGERRSLAADTIARWASANERPTVRVAMPQGPGARLLFALVAADWAAIGVDAEAVALDDPGADLRLIDEVAPSGSATWYLRRFMCERSRVCSAQADAALDAARAAPTPLERALRIAEADERLEEIVPYIPIAMPLRWSLVSPRLTRFQPNALAVHPLNHLIEDVR